MTWSDWIALYGAILSTAIGVWEAYKYWTRVNVQVSATMNMETFPNNDGKTYVFVQATNRGDLPLTITNFVGISWKNHFERIFFKKRKAQHFIVAIGGPLGSPVPHQIGTGEIWRGFINQDEELEKRIKNQVLYVGIYHSMSDKPVMCRVFYYKAKTHSERK